jgi:hypothetical protein
MRRYFLLYFFLAIVLTAAGCNSDKNVKKGYEVLVVGEENVVNEGDFTNNESSIIKFQHITKLEDARQRYPRYEIEKTPAIFIFATDGGEMKKLELKTYNVEEAVDFLEEN